MSATQTIDAPAELASWEAPCGLREDWPEQMPPCDHPATHYAVFHNAHVLLTCEPCYQQWLPKALHASTGWHRRRWVCITCGQLFDLRTQVRIQPL